MELEENLNRNHSVEKFDKTIIELIERLEINQIVCISNEIDQKKWNKDDVEEYLSSNSNNKIEVTTAMFFNDVEKLVAPSQVNENDELEETFNSAFKFLNDKIDQLCQQGENRYLMNELIRNAVRLVEFQQRQMNYESWLVRKNAYLNKDIFSVLINSERVKYIKNHFDLEKWCMQDIDFHFGLRRQLLQNLKNHLCNIFSKYLLLPNIEKIPTFKFNGDDMEICELILALSKSRYFEDGEELKTHLLEMFNISAPVFTKCKYEITKVRNVRSKFLIELYEEFDEQN